jgi:hypothetical protein
MGVPDAGDPFELRVGMGADSLADSNSPGGSNGEN